MKKTYLGDWNRNFLPIQVASNLHSKAPLSNKLIYKEMDFTVHELFVNAGVISFNVVDYYLKNCFSIIKLIGLLLNGDNFGYETVYTTKETFLNKNEEEISDFALLLENGFTEKLLLARIQNLFNLNNQTNKFANLFQALFKTNLKEDNYVIYMYFIGCFIEIYHLHNYMLKHDLKEINLATKTLSITKVNTSFNDNYFMSPENAAYFISEIFLKGDIDNYIGCIHSYALNLFDEKDYFNSFNAFMLNENVKNKAFCVKDLSIYLNDSYFEIVDLCDITKSQKQVLKFLFNYIQYKVLKDSIEAKKNNG